jgi:hypothetical protein
MRLHGVASQTTVLFCKHIFSPDRVTHVWSSIVLVENTLRVKVHSPLILHVDELNQ